MTKDEIKVGDRINTPKGMGTVKCACGGYLTVMLDNGEWWVNMNAILPKEDKPTDEIKCGDRFETPHGVLIVDMMAGENIFGHYENGDFGMWTKKELNRCKTQPNDHTITIPVKADLDDTYWDAYRAELVKELALKLIGSNEIRCLQNADHITDFVTRIIDNLKKQSE